jgi:hypothetical protein
MFIEGNEQDIRVQQPHAHERIFHRVVILNVIIILAFRPFAEQ